MKQSIFFLFLFFSGGTTVLATVFILENHCSYTVWPGTLSANGAAILAEGGFELPPGSSTKFPAPAGWSGRFWARTGCQFDDFRKGNCETGDCGTGLRCGGGGGAPPVTLAEFTIGSGAAAEEKDFYDVSLVDGHNVGIGIHPIPTGYGGSGGSGECRYAGCVADVNGGCPYELRITGGNGDVVACRSACAAFDSPEFCCTGEYSTPETCSPTEYSAIFKTACPTAYSYAYDDASSTRTCIGSDYLISFCPTGWS